MGTIFSKTWHVVLTALAEAVAIAVLGAFLDFRAFASSPASHPVEGAVLLVFAAVLLLAVGFHLGILEERRRLRESSAAVASAKEELDRTKELARAEREALAAASMRRAEIEGTIKAEESELARLRQEADDARETLECLREQASKEVGSRTLADAARAVLDIFRGEGGAAAGNRR